ncbi:MAG: LicD family protein, partial [Steroidobacteraceae bacterium]
MRKLNEHFYRLRWGPLEERRRRGLIRLHDTLAGTSFADRYWMIMGLLLGCMRDGAPIAWDRDSDFGFMEKDLPPFLTAVRK